MYSRDKVVANVDKSREFGVFGDIFRELQREEMKEIETNLGEIREISLTQNMLEIMTEISSTLKEIAETQKKILEELQTNKVE
ncbi:MAG: hypothetical protein QM426_11840 [Euryarchaeota archaeon]|nr:hypothetical protein [Euryarchaeota archaeon]